MKNNCEKFRDLFFLGVGNDLTEELQSDLNKHLTECADCKKEFDEISKLNSVFDVLRSDLSKIERNVDLTEIRSRNLEFLKRKCKKTSKILLYQRMLNPIAAAVLILVISLSLFLFPNTPTEVGNTKSLTSSKINTESPETSTNNKIEPIPPFGVGTISTNPVKKNEFNDKISELKMKFPDTHQGHYLQGAYVRDRNSISYTSKTNRVKAGMSEEMGNNPVGFKPTQTKIESSLDDKKPVSCGF